MLLSILYKKKKNIKKTSISDISPFASLDEFEFDTLECAL